MSLENRITKLEGKFGSDDEERWIRSLTDEELEQEIAALQSELRRRLTAVGVDCVDMPIEEVSAKLEVLEAGK